MWRLNLSKRDISMRWKGRIDGVIPLWWAVLTSFEGGNNLWWKKDGGSLEKVIILKDYLNFSRVVNIEMLKKRKSREVTMGIAAAYR